MESSTASAATAAALVISTTIHSASALAEGPSLPSLPPPAAQSDEEQKVGGSKSYAKSLRRQR